jgi:hypothetical protein
MSVATYVQLSKILIDTHAQTSVTTHMQLGDLSCISHATGWISLSNHVQLAKFKF